ISNTIILNILLISSVIRVQNYIILLHIIFTLFFCCCIIKNTTAGWNSTDYFCNTYPFSLPNASANAGKTLMICCIAQETLIIPNY
ncbi:hypothetical protein ACJX0J_034845, partial [Zea mays]